MTSRESQIAHVLLGIFSWLSVGTCDAKPFETFYEPPEDVVVKAVYFYERCADVFPKLKGKLDASFASFQKRNAQYFDATLAKEGFQDGYAAFKNHFSGLPISENGCNEVVRIFSAPTSNIEDKSK
jgi:hypothetical protein